MNNTHPVVRIITATEAQNKFGAILKRAYGSAEHLIIERDGIPVAALIPMSDYQRLVPESPTPAMSARVSAAGQRDRALRDLSAFLDAVHARMPDVDELEGERLVSQAVNAIRRPPRRRRAGSKRK